MTVVTRKDAREDMRLSWLNPALSLKVLPTHSKRLVSIAPITNPSLMIVAEHD
jgi:hypothetical protein